MLLAVAMPAASARAPWVGTELSGAPCQGNSTGYGPFDYTNPRHVREKLGVVERHHFTRQVAALESGKSGSLLSDLDYTIRAFPNHHQALYSLIRLYMRDGRGPAINDWPTPPECYLQRALQFTPKDHRVHTLYGIYLHRLDRLERAAEMYRQALELQPASAEAHYNLGLLLVDMQRFEEARTHAREAYEAGHPLPGLRRKLAAAGFPL